MLLKHGFTLNNINNHIFEKEYDKIYREKAKLQILYQKTQNQTLLLKKQYHHLKQYLSTESTNSLGEEKNNSHHL